MARMGLQRLQPPIFLCQTREKRTMRRDGGPRTRQKTKRNFRLGSRSGPRSAPRRRLGERMRKTNCIPSVILAAVFAILLGLAGTVLREAKAGPPQETQVPKFEVDPLWPKPLPELWVTGEV